jgi:hypothetical protein
VRREAQISATKQKDDLFSLSVEKKQASDAQASHWVLHGMQGLLVHAFFIVYDAWR